MRIMEESPNPELRRELLRRRFDRQFQQIYRTLPWLRRPLERIRARGWWVVRVPLALIFIVGAFLAILPVFGLWMLPIGLILLAIDLPVLQGPVTAMMIRVRRWWELKMRARRNRR
ncbi:hypothetical protein Wenmar_03995 [Wenxinia marina DSM 24838]|uniref:Transmembrane protein (PGPGW) n=2 Tax=Wenxinia TaxID=653686 RepID=A0A0D0PYR5_9RHOB|nr:hypothetical protein [Wenxinia marina]KIQ67569.1 hypothetical protein Wenmar_03995 [Wenxinia marina DSM 24838]